MKNLKFMIPPLPWHEPIHRSEGDERVILLHGLWGTVLVMEPLAKNIHEHGFETLNIPYSSFRKPLTEIVDSVADLIRGSDKKTHFVTHSMGGIVVRSLAHRYPDLVTGRIVMLAPPNQGSEIIDWLEDCPLAQWSLGPGGMNLSSKRVQSEIPSLASHHPLKIIMGNKASSPFFNYLFKSEHDGIVTVSGGNLPEQDEFEVIHANHTFISGEEEAIEKAITFLKG